MPRSTSAWEKEDIDGPFILTFLFIRDHYTSKRYPMSDQEREIYMQLAKFYCPQAYIDKSEACLTLSSTKPLRSATGSEHSMLAIQPQNCSVIGHHFVSQVPNRVYTDIVLKRTREFTMMEPIMALEQAGSSRFLVGTASCSVIEFDTDLRKISIFRQLHTNRISVLHSVRTEATSQPAYFLSGSDDHLIKLNSHERGMTIQTFVGSSTGITSLSYEPRNDIFISANRSGQVHMWSQKAQRPLCLYSCPNAGNTLPATLAQFTPCPEYFVAASGTFLSLWDLRYNGRPVISTNLLPSYAESLVPLDTTGDTNRYLELHDNIDSVHPTSYNWAVLTGKGLFRVALGDNPHVLQSVDELSTSKVCGILPCNLFIKQSEPLESYPCLLITNRERQKESTGTDESTPPLTILSQSDYRQRLKYLCKRPHKIGRAAHTTYLKPNVLEPDNQGFILVSSDSTMLHLYRIGIRSSKKYEGGQQSKNKEINDQ